MNRLLDRWMGPGLRTLVGLRVRAALRTSVGRLRTPSGWVVPLAVAGVWSLAVVARVFQDEAPRFSTDTFERIGPAVLAAGWAALVSLRGGGEQIGFSPAEADQLFAAPHTERQLLRYKLALLVVTWTVAAALLGPLASVYTRAAIAGPLVAGLLFPGLQLSVMNVALLVDRRSGVGSRLGLFAILLALVGASLGVVPDEGTGLVDGIEAVVQHPVGQVVLLPFAAATWLFLSEDPQVLAQAALVLLLSNLGLAALVLVQGRSTWIEQAATGAQRRATLVERYRSGGLGANGALWKVAVPRPPTLGGIGPIAWRRIIEMVRRPLSFLAFLWPLGAAASVGFVAHVTYGRDQPEVVAVTALASLGWTLLLVPSSLRLDFRSDLDRIDQLLALPRPALAIVVGQLLPMTALLAFAAELVVAVSALWQPDLAAWCGFAAVVAPLAASLVVTTENLTFLWLPVRIETGEAALQSVGRNLFTALLSYMVNVVLLSVTIGIGVVVGWVLDRIALGAAITATALALSTLAMLGLAAWRFRTFDPSRDVPG